MPKNTITDPTTGETADVPHLEQYAGLWAMEEKAFSLALERVRGTDLIGHVRAEQAAIEQARAAAPAAAAGERAYQVDAAGIATVELVGAMTKYGSSFSRLRGGTSGLRRTLRAMKADASVKGVLMVVDSPGGTVAGSGDLAETVSDLATVKPVLVRIEDLGASAAYRVAAMGTRIAVNPSGLVGSIGTYAVIEDWSAAYAKAGVKTHVVRAGQFKGAGANGAEVTAEQLANWQREVNAVNELFLADVAKGRGLSLDQVRELATGQVWTAEAARQVGLVDAVETADSSMSRLAAMVQSPRPKSKAAQKETRMSTEPAAATQAATPPPAPTPATVADLKAAFPKSSAEFRENCLERGLTLDQATRAWAGELEKQLQAAEAATAAAKTEAETAKASAKRPGVEPLTSKAPGKPADEPTTSATDRFNELVAEQMAAGKPRHKAFEEVCRTHKQLREEMVAEHNERHQTAGR